MTPGSAAWLQRLTASRFGRVMRGRPSWPSLRREMLSAEAGAPNRGAGVPSLEHGRENESRACALYSIRTGRALMSPGFRLAPRHSRVGATVDRLTDCGRVLEVKCPVRVDRHLSAAAGVYDVEYWWQLQGGLWVWEADEGDFVSFSEDPLVDIDEQLIIIPVARDDDAIAKLEREILAFWEWFDGPTAEEAPVHDFVKPGAARAPKLF